MARAATPPPPKESARLTAEQMNTGITRLERRISELEQFDVNKRGSEEADSGSAYFSVIFNSLRGSSVLLSAALTTSNTRRALVTRMATPCSRR